MIYLIYLFIYLLSLSSLANAQCYSGATVASGYCVEVWKSGVSGPREMFVLPNNDVLVVERNLARISVLYTVGSTVQITPIAYAPGLNHAVTVYNGVLYASNITTVFRWKNFVQGGRSNLGAPEIVVKNIPGDYHTTRTLLFLNGYLLVSVGAGSDLDSNTDRSGVYKFDISTVPRTWADRKTYVNGLRNAVGLGLDPQGNLYATDAGSDNLFRSDLGATNNNNPAEEINLLTEGKFYGYPYCWSAANVTGGYKMGTQFAYPQTRSTISDAKCQDTTYNTPPVFTYPAHWTPLDILFYKGTSFPGINTGDAFVAFHGSAYLSTPIGFRVSLLSFQNGQPVKETNFLTFASEAAGRPNNLAFATCSGVPCMLVASDKTNQIFAVKVGSTCCGSTPAPTTRAPTPAPTTRAPTPAPTPTVTCPAGWTSIGCYTDSSKARGLSAKSFSSAQMTVESCASYCSGYNYFGVEFAKECYCGNQIVSPSTKASTSDCNLKCTGNSAEFCGAGDRLGVCQRTSSSPSPSSSPAGRSCPAGWTPKGCWSDKSTQRTLASKSYTSTTAMTVESCASFCAGYKYFGTEFAKECYCGDSLPSSSFQVATEQCYQKCTGSSSEYCGAGDRLSLCQSTA